MLAGSGMYANHRDMDGMGLEPGHHHNFSFQPTGAARLAARRRQQTEDSNEEQAPMTSRERSISAPNVSHTIMSEAVLPESVYRHAHRDLRSE